MSVFKRMWGMKRSLAHTTVLTVVVLCLFFARTQTANAQFFGIVPQIVFDPTVNASLQPIIINTSVTAAAAVTTAALESSNTAKEFVGDGVANFIAKAILRKLTAQTVNWINSGFKGNPAFVTNPDQFFLSLGDQIAVRYLSEGQKSALNAICSPFQAQIRLQLVKSYLSETQPLLCSLGTLENNYKNFINNFQNGGWSNWFAMTQSTQGNPYGTYLDAKNQLSLQIGAGKYKYTKQLDWGKGFLSYEKCVAYADSSAVDESDELDAVNGDSIDGQCIAKETVTPGSVIENQLENVFGSSVKQLEAADEINEIVSALLTQMVSRVVGGVAGGLRGLGTKSSTQPRSFIEQLNDNSPEVKAETEAFDARLQATLPSFVQATTSEATTTPLWQPPTREEIKAAADAARTDTFGPSGGAPTTQSNP